MTNRELDREMAEFMGWNIDNLSEVEELNDRVVFSPTTLIQDAILIVGKMIDKGFKIDIQMNNDKGEWFCIFFRYEDVFDAEADTPSMAICLAARKAIRNGK